MLISTVITRQDWSRIEHAWTAALRRFELEQDWEILQVTDEGSIRRFSLKANRHDDHETTEVVVDIRIRESASDMPEGTEVFWDASKRVTKLPSCEAKYVEECNSRTQGVIRLTPDEPFGNAVGSGL